MKLGPDDHLHVEGFALNVFAKADKQDRAGRADLYENFLAPFYSVIVGDKFPVFSLHFVEIILFSWGAYLSSFGPSVLIFYPSIYKLLNEVQMWWPSCLKKPSLY